MRLDMNLSSATDKWVSFHADDIAYVSYLAVYR